MHAHWQASKATPTTTSEDEGAAVLDDGQDADITDIDNINYADGALIVEVIVWAAHRVEDVIGIDIEDGVIALSDGIERRK